MPDFFERSPWVERDLEGGVGLLAFPPQTAEESGGLFSLLFHAK